MKCHRYKRRLTQYPVSVLDRVIRRRFRLLHQRYMSGDKVPADLVAADFRPYPKRQRLHDKAWVRYEMWKYL